MMVALSRLLAVFVPSLLLAATPSIGGELVVAYVPNWVDVDSLSAKVDLAKVTHVNVAFENPTNAQGDLSFHKKNEAILTWAHSKGTKVLVSIGGGGASGDKKLQALYFDLLTDAKRGDFVKRLGSYVEEHGFDGLDVDIEGPSINKDYGALIRDLSAVLKPKGKLLTSALSQGYGGKNVPDSAFEHFDFVNIMAYDGAGPWDPNAPGQHSSMEFASKNVDYWLRRGLPESKAVLGVPFYGYGFGKDFREGGYSYAQIVARHPEAPKADQVGETIWYNGVSTIEAKAGYAVDRKLAGVMIWSLDQDVPGENSLLDAVHRGFKARKPDAKGRE